MAYRLATYFAVEGDASESLHWLRRAIYLGNELRKHFGNERVIGPEAPLIGRIRNYYIKSIMLKFEKDGVSMIKAKATIRDIITQFQTTKLSKGSIVQADVDPV